MTAELKITNALLLQVSTEALRQHIGPHRQFSYYDVASGIDVDERTVESWVLGRSVPSLPHWLRLCSFINNNEFTNQFLRVAGFDGADKPEQRFVADSDMNATVAKLTSIMSDALADLRIDHMERVKVMKVAADAHQLLGDFLSSHSRTAQLREVK